MISDRPRHIGGGQDHIGLAGQFVDGALDPDQPVRQRKNRSVMRAQRVGAGALTDMLYVLNVLGVRHGQALPGRTLISGVSF